MKYFFVLLLLTCSAAGAQIRQIKSPDGRLRVVVQTHRPLSFSLYYDNRPLLLSSEINMVLDDGTALTRNTGVRKFSIRQVLDTIYCPVPEKRKKIVEHFTELRIDFRQPFTLIFRAYDDGAAYRFATRRADSIQILQETARFRFSPGANVYYPEVSKRNGTDSFHTSFEEPYQFRRMDSLPSAALCFSPVLITMPNEPKLLLTESDLEDYPGMFLRGTGDFALQGVFAPYPLEDSVADGEYPESVVSKQAPYIARVKGTRNYPWRVMVVAPLDRDLPSNDLVYRLASPSRIGDASWVRPGKATDEWIININLFNVSFRSGINTETYKYYIDFAKRFGFDRIMMDAGWSDTRDLFRITPGLDIEEIMRYARTRGIKVSMWTLAKTLDRQLDSALDQFGRWGVDFIMTDFIDRDDQQAVRFYYRIAEACAKKKIMIMYHGAYKPAGFERTFPNAITRESVLGSEYNIWSDKANPPHDLLLPFIRMVSGPMDYEPGLLDNATRDQFRPISGKVMSQGTRCHQLAMFVVYDNPMQIFSGNPSQGLLEPDFMSLLGSTPTVWNETLIPDARLGEYIVSARQHGDNWYVGALTNWTGRTLSIPLHFLGEGNYKVTVCEDGTNADHYASDYRIRTLHLNKSDTLSISMAPGGGYYARFEKE